MPYHNKIAKNMTIQYNNYTYCLYFGEAHPGHFNQVGLPRYFYTDNFTQVTLPRWVYLGKFTVDNFTNNK